MPAPKPASDALAAYLTFFETLTESTLHRIDELTTEDVRFRDPFSDLEGRAAFRRVFEKMFADVAAPRFHIRHHAGDGAIHYVRWEFSAMTRGRRPRPLHLHGVSEIHLAADGRIAAHIDHWDAASQLYESLPLLGWILRRLKRRLAVSR